MYTSSDISKIGLIKEMHVCTNINAYVMHYAYV